MIYLRKIEEKDLDKYEYYKMPHHRYHELNGPYFAKDTKDQVKENIDNLRIQLSSGVDDLLPQRRMIIDRQDDSLIGEVSYSWRSKETWWMEIGIVIFDESYWGKGIGLLATTKWIHYLFSEFPQLVRIGFTTWSGNIGMIKLGEKLNFHQEARYRKARIVYGKYYDSISYGILKEEWDAINQ